jgi:hypothetical protein
MISEGTIVQVAGTRDTKVPERGNDFRRSYSSSGGKKRHKGARELMTLAGTIQ